MGSPSQDERRSLVNIEDIIHAWRDEEYHDSLNAEQRAALPESPVGSIDLSEEELREVDGGSDPTAGPICITASIVTATLTIIGSGTCSIIDGGTCAGDTSGCCKE
jgi:mersacidin/lichenicidin family type 2 lantibiotic